MPGKERSQTFQPDLTRKVLEDHLRRLGGPPYLEEILKFKLNCRRDQQIGAVEEPTDPSGKEVEPAREYPGHPMDVPIDQGRHSSDQSRWTNSSGSVSR